MNTLKRIIISILVLLILILLVIISINIDKNSDKNTDKNNIKKVNTEQSVKVDNVKIMLSENPDLSNICHKSYFYEDNMQYMLIKDYVSGGIAVINLTKDKLECELYKKQLTKYY